jgi:biotin synthase
MTKYDSLAERVLEGHVLTDEEALSVLDSPDEDLLLLLHAAYKIRKHYYGNKVKLNMIMNTKSGLCPENCGYCAQSIISKAPIEKYSMMKRE